jgi:glycosyltransferase involved in cell wall biosynthesis
MAANDSISVVIPAFNAEPYLGAAIESVLGQTRSAAQVIVVDDGSTDATSAVAEKFDDAVILIQQRNAGVSAARNNGAAAVAADWLLFLDADDLLRPDALERLAVRASEGDFGVVYGQTIYFDERKGMRRLHGRGAAEGAVPAAARANFWKSVIATPGAAITRRVVFEETGGFRAEFNTAADRDFWLRAGSIAQFGFVETPVTEKREHEQNMSGDKSRARRQAAEVQLSFLAWCAARRLPKPPHDEREILSRNLERALTEGSLSAAEWLLDQAKACGFIDDEFRRAERMLAMPGFARELELRVRALFAK